jgi:hypothetical protein
MRFKSGDTVPLRDSITKTVSVLQIYEYSRPKLVDAILFTFLQASDAMIIFLNFIYKK